MYNFSVSKKDVSLLGDRYQTHERKIAIQHKPIGFWGGQLCNLNVLKYNNQLGFICYSLVIKLRSHLYNDTWLVSFMNYKLTILHTIEKFKMSATRIQGFQMTTLCCQKIFDLEECGIKIWQVYTFIEISAIHVCMISAFFMSAIFSPEFAKFC